MPQGVPGEGPDEAVVGRLHAADLTVVPRREAVKKQLRTDEQ